MMGPIHLSVDDRVAVITIDRTERRNALNLDALEALDTAVADALRQGAAAIVFTGAGGHFCAGADLKELEDHTFDTRLRGVLENVATAPVPTFAAISGACMGLGMQLALACDMAAIVTTCDWDEASRRRSAMSGRERETLERAIEWAQEWKRYDRWRTIGGAALAAEESPKP